MAKYLITDRAIADLTDIWEYTEREWSEIQAERYYLSLLESCEELAINPTLGKQYDTVTPNLLGYKSGRHIIFYSILVSNEVQIIRILHDMMDLKRKI
jgi:toxin ParE1/3/4